MPSVAEQVVLDEAGLAALFAALRADGFSVVGPTVRDGAVVLDTIASIDELPRGVGDAQEPGKYRLRERNDGALFGWAVGPHSPKQWLFRPRVELVQIRLTSKGFESTSPPAPSEKLAFFGIRPCEVAGIAVQDRVFLGAATDPDYAARRAGAFVFAVHCGEPSGTCFCVSMGTGPATQKGFDLAATELVGPPHVFVVDVGSERGAALLAQVPQRAAAPTDTAEARRVVDEASKRMGRQLNTEGLPQALAMALEHPRWDEVAARCLGCANCTMVCPTCFCSTVEDTTDLTGEVATRSRRWDSCFSADFAYVHGGSARPSLRARYRQWLTHKLSSWHEQFDSSGCVGCGRCITWCPVGIDITEEAAAIAAPAAKG